MTCTERNETVEWLECIFLSGIPEWVHSVPAMHVDILSYVPQPTLHSPFPHRIMAVLKVLLAAAQRVSDAANWN